MPRIRLRRQFGAIVQVEIRLPPDLRRERRALGVHTGTVKGEALVDTGSDVTAFDLKAARHAGLVESGTGRLSTGFGAFTVLRGRGFHLSHLDYLAVIGRDILRHGVLVYNGREGWATLSRDGD